MAKKVIFSDLPISQWQAGDTVAVFRNGKVVRIPAFGKGDVPEGPKLAAVATSGKYSDLTGRPVLGTAASKNEGDFATADQGSKGVTAFSWGNHSEAGYALAASVTQGLSQKVDKQPGYGLSQQNFTLVEKQKLAGLESSRYKGLFPAVSALNTGVISPSAGDYADVDAGSGSDVQRYIWDDSDQKWIAQSGAVPPITAAQVKGLYESNPDTNAFTNQQKADLESVFSWGDHREQGYVLSTDGRLSNAREWTASTVSQSEAETGTATTARKWTAQRVRQAAVAAWNSVTSAWGRGLVNSADAAAGRAALGLGNVENTKDVDKRVGSFTIRDTRSVVSVPDNVPSSTGLFEFKYVSSVGTPPKPSNANYAHVLTTNGWTADGTGGWPTQVSLGAALSFRKGSGKTTWGPWHELISTDTTLGATGQSALYPMTQKATTDALDAKANSAITITGTGALTGGGNLTGSRTIDASAATKASLAKADSALQNGAYGLGKNLPAKVLDANHIADEAGVSTGLYPYLSNSGSTNVPHTYVYIFQIFYANAGNCTQIAYGYNKARTWIRFRFSGVWSPWQEQIVPESLLDSTGNSSAYPMSQKAVTDALATKASTSTQVIAGNGLSGGGTLSADRTLSVKYGTTAGTAAQGNDARLSNAREWTAAEVSQAEAEAGTATTARKWTAQRVRQNVAAYTYSKSEIDDKIDAGGSDALTLAQAQAIALYF